MKNKCNHRWFVSLLGNTKCCKACYERQVLVQWWNKLTGLEFWIKIK